MSGSRDLALRPDPFGAAFVGVLHDGNAPVALAAVPVALSEGIAGPRALDLHRRRATRIDVPGVRQAAVGADDRPCIAGETAIPARARSSRSGCSTRTVAGCGSAVLHGAAASDEREGDGSGDTELCRQPHAESVARGSTEGQATRRRSHFDRAASQGRGGSTWLHTFGTRRFPASHLVRSLRAFWSRYSRASRASITSRTGASRPPRHRRPRRRRFSRHQKNPWPLRLASFRWLPIRRRCLHRHRAAPPIRPGR